MDTPNYDTWFANLYDYMAFDYSIKIPVDSEDYKRKLPEFLVDMLTLGWETKMYIVPNSAKHYGQFIQEWKANLIADLDSRGPIVLRLLNYQHAPDSLLPFYPQLEIPKGDNWELFPARDPGTAQDQIMEVECQGPNELGMNHQDYYWYEYLKIDFYSYSNIWLKEIEINYYPGFRRPIYLDLEVDNSIVARKILPRFNTFLRGIRSLTEKLEGTVELQETSYSNMVTPEGILYDGKLLFD